MAAKKNSRATSGAKKTGAGKRSKTSRGKLAPGRSSRGLAAAALLVTFPVLLLTITICALVAVPEAAQPQSGVTAIRAGRVIDPDTGTAAVNQVILIANGRITAVGRDVACPQPDRC